MWIREGQEIYKQFVKTRTLTSPQKGSESSVYEIITKNIKWPTILWISPNNPCRSFIVYFYRLL